MPHPATLASDADREHAVALLREHHAAGRLTADELGDRIAQAYRARTHADLGAVMAGLPTTLPAAGEAAVPAVRGGYTGGQVAAAALVTFLVPFGHVIALVTSAVMLRDEQVPERRRMLQVWLAASITLLVIDAVLILLFVVR